MSTYTPVGLCIYCGERKLPQGVRRFGDEHIIPLALGGNLILPEASCKKCERTINKLIETPISRQEWGYFRSKYELPTRDKKRRKTHIVLKKRDGSPLKVPIKDYAAPVPLYLFSEARILSGRAASLDQHSWTVRIISNDDAEMAMKSKYPEWDERHKLKMRTYEFARLIAKIGYSYATAELGHSSFDPLVPDIILGKSDDLFYLVGGSWDLGAPVPDGDHLTEIKAYFIRLGVALVIVEFRMFSAFSTPTYHAVVGTIDLHRPEHLVAFEKHRLNGRIEHITL